MKRSLWLLLSLGLLLGIIAACNPAKPPKNGGSTDIDYSDSDFTPETCAPGGAARKLNFGNWSAGMPASPEETVVIIDPGHGGRDGGACIGVAGNGECPNNVFCTSELKAAGASSLVEAELTFTTAARLQALLQRLGFQVGLTRTDGHGKRGLSVSATMSGQAGSYQGRDIELTLRGWECRRAFRTFTKSGCPWPNLKSESSVSLILKQAGVPLNYPLTTDPRVAYISLHFDSAAANSRIGPNIMAGKVRDDTNKLVVNPALGGGQPMDYTGNYVRFLADHMVASVRQSGTLDQFNRATEVDFEDGYAGANQSFSFQNGPLQGSGLTGEYKYRRGNFGTVSVVSGVDGVSKKPKNYIASIPQNLTFEVANMRDCGNVVALARSVNRGGGFDAHNTPLDPTDPLDVAAEDIAHGLVEYYECYVPGFKQKACDNLSASDWAGQGWQLPAWCSSTGGGGGGGNAVPDIDNVVLDPTSVEIPVGQSASAALSFSNAGKADLSYSVSADIPQVSITSASSGTVAPGASVSVGVSYSCKPDEPGRFEGAVSVSSNDPDTPMVLLQVIVECTAPEISVSPLPLPYVTAINYIGRAHHTDWVLPDTFDFFESGGKMPLEFSLEIPPWLQLAPNEGVIEPGGRYSRLASKYTPKVHCEDPGEQEGEIVIRSNDPLNPVVRVPVRLICPVLQVAFSPETYDGEECPPLTGTITVLNAPHLKELYTEVIQGSNNVILDVHYNEPQFIYFPQNTPKTRLKRWPIVHGEGGEGTAWSWDLFPRFPFSSWMNSCGYAAMGNSEHRVEEFYLLHPRRNDANQQKLFPFAAGISTPISFFTPSPFPGTIRNPTTYVARGAFSIGNFPRQTYTLAPYEFTWARFSFGMHGEKVKYYDSDGKEVASFNTPGTRHILSWGDLWGCRFFPDAVDNKESYWSHEIPTNGGPFRVVGRTCYPSLKLTDYPYYEPPWLRGEDPVVEDPVVWNY